MISTNLVNVYCAIDSLLFLAYTLKHLQFIPFSIMYIFDDRKNIDIDMLGTPEYFFGLLQVLCDPWSHAFIQY